MSHELRTPMNAILGFTRDDDRRALRRRARRAEGAAHRHPGERPHLLRLINDVLDLSKIEAGRMELALGEYSVSDVVDTVRASLRSLAAEKGLEFTAHVPDDLPVAYGDSGRLTQCLMNLAGNALKFTRAGRVSTSRSSCAGDELIYRVADTGIGIADSRTRQHLRRVPPGRRDHHARVRRHRPRAQHHEEVRGDASAAASGSRASSARARPSCFPCRLRAGEAQRMSEHTILYVEDNEYNRKIVRQLLSRIDLPPDRGGRRRGGRRAGAGSTCPI